ncbi:MAG: membrane protein insertase YidC, partial [Isosphaeraceae bacterium]
ADDETATPDDEAAQTKTIRLENRLWEVVAEDGKPAVRPIIEPDPTTKKPVEVGQQITLRTNAGKPAVTVTKTYTFRKGQDGLEMELGFTGQGEGRRIAYELNGPRGLPIEGEWYTSNFRDVFVEQAGGTGIVTETAHDVVKAEEKDKSQRFLKFPLAFAGAENQYFAVFFAPEPETRTPERRWDQETVPTVVHKNETDSQKSDVSVVMTSRDFEVGRNLSTTHRYQIYAGPKTPDRLAAYGAVELATFRKGWSMLGVGTLARNVAQYIITPLLNGMYDVTLTVSRIFGGTRGNYGIAIIMLVIAVRLSLFPISRKQAIMAKKMQELQPQLTALRTKYKEDPAKLMKASQALQRKNGVSMLGGCLPALIQVPIFMGLWQALNNSFALRQEPFLFWIHDLSAPDMLFPFPFDMKAVPLVGPMLGPYFNVLPLFSAALMLVHTKLFAPPPTTPEAEMQQKMMKYMMVFMAVMLYRVPSGLGIYFITSSSWAIAERIILPKTAKRKPIVTLDDDEPNKHGGGGKGGSDDPPTPSGGGWLARKFEKLLEEAAKDPTVRNRIEKIRDPGSPGASPGDRDRGKPRPRPKTPPSKRR